jgi:hypothetical protein
VGRQVAMTGKTPRRGLSDVSTTESDPNRGLAIESSARAESEGWPDLGSMESVSSARADSGR